MMDIEKTAAEMVAGVDSRKYPMAEQLAEEVIWQAQRLTESRESIRNAPIVMPYDNGGGQTGLRKNPMYDAYNSLFASFVKGMAQLDEILGSAPQTSASSTLIRLRELQREKRVG